jgi:hypothetical protein
VCHQRLHPAPSQPGSAPTPPLAQRSLCFAGRRRRARSVASDPAPKASLHFKESRSLAERGLEHENAARLWKIAEVGGLDP